jgi:hypothetical protein
METEVTATDHAFGEHDMYQPEPEPTTPEVPITTVTVWRYQEPAITYSGVSSCIIEEGFVRIVQPAENVVTCHNINDVTQLEVSG